jgi:hypothetical protein
MVSVGRRVHGRWRPKMTIQVVGLLLTLVATGCAVAPGGGGIQYSPAGCTIKAQKAHPSSHFPNTVNHIAQTNCNWFVYHGIAVWGERSSWSGWRNHAQYQSFGPFSATGLTENSASYCLNGTYDYRSRGFGQSWEGGQTYSAIHTGQTARIKRVQVSGGFVCAWA